MGSDEKGLRLMSLRTALQFNLTHPVFHFPLFIYTREEAKSLSSFGKWHLVNASLVLARMDYFRKVYPDIHVLPFASYTGMKVVCAEVEIIS